MDIAVRENEKQILKNFYINRIEELRENVKQIEFEINDTVERLSELGFTDLFLNNTETGLIVYSQSWTMAKKAEFTLQTSHEYLTTREIIENLLPYEPWDDNDIKNMVDGLASTLKQKVDKGDTFIRISEDGAFKYGLKKWVTERAIVK